MKDWLILFKTLKKGNGTCALLMRGISCDQMRHITFISMLDSDPNHCAFHCLAQHHTVTRSKACEKHRRQGLELRSWGARIASWYSTGFIIKRLQVQILAEAAGELSSLDLTASYSDSVPSPCYSSGMQKTPVICNKRRWQVTPKKCIHPWSSEVGVGNCAI